MTNHRKERATDGRNTFIKQQRLKAGKYFESMGASVKDRTPYLLRSHDDWPRNIIVPEVAAFIADRIQRREGHFALHTYVHHGLSSQAFLWNLLGPLAAGGRVDILTEIVALAFPGTAEVVSAEFEYEDRLVLGESGGQPTSVDLMIYRSDGSPIVLEFKYTEPDFGPCSVFRDGDCDGRNPATDHSLCYLHLIGRKYWDLLEEYGLLTGNMLADSQCPFTSLYQAYRLVLFALVSKGELLLVHDDRSPVFVTSQNGIARGVWGRVIESLPAEVQQKCAALSVQDIMGVLEQHPDLNWVSELQDKYF